MMILVSFLMAAVGSIGALALADKAEEDNGNDVVNRLVAQSSEFSVPLLVWITLAGLNKIRINNNFKTYKAQISV